MISNYFETSLEIHHEYKQTIIDLENDAEGCVTRKTIYF